MRTNLFASATRLFLQTFCRIFDFRTTTPGDFDTTIVRAMAGYLYSALTDSEKFTQGAGIHDNADHHSDRLLTAGIEVGRAVGEVEGYQPRPFGCEVGSHFHQRHVSRSPPIMPDGRVSQVRFEASAFRR